MLGFWPSSVSDHQQDNGTEWVKIWQDGRNQPKKGWIYIPTGKDRQQQGRLLLYSQPSSFQVIWPRMQSMESTLWFSARTSKYTSIKWRESRNLHSTQFNYAEKNADASNCQFWQLVWKQFQKLGSFTFPKVFSHIIHFLSKFSIVAFYWQGNRQKYEVFFILDANLSHLNNLGLTR